MEQITMVNAAVQPASEQDILGAAAAEYVKLQAKMATLKAQLKELEHALVRIFFLLLIFISFVLFLMIIF